MTALYYTYYPSPVGRLLILSDGESITHIDFEKEQYEPNPKWHKQDELPVFQKVRLAFERYFNGEVERFSDIPLKPEGTAFQQAICKPCEKLIMANFQVMESWRYGLIILKLFVPWEAR